MNDMDSTTEPKDVGMAKRTWKGHSLGFWVLEAVSAFARFYMAYIWISAGSAKLNQHLSVTQTIEGYEIFTPEWSSALAHLIGPLEIAGGVFLLLGLFLKPASWVSTTVLVLFIIGVGSAWARGLMIDCGCFTIDISESDQAMNYLRTILRDVFYIFLSVWIARRPFRRLAIYP